MAELNREDALMTVMLRHFGSHWLPDTLDIKERVDRGEVLSDWAAEFLDEALRDISHTKPLVDRHPELQPLYARTAVMFLAITHRALENEKAQFNIN